MKLHRVVFALALAFGCSSSSSAVDAPSGASDSAKSIDAPRPDASFMDAALPACTGLAYDRCNPAASNCQNGMQCHTFTGSGFSVCTPSCAGNAACPDQGSTAVTCNNMSLCKPPAPNADCSTP
jgi:hypothetical protein